MTTPAPAGQSGFETTSYAYDADGNLTQVSAPPPATGGQPEVTASTYNSAGEIASQTTGTGSAASTVSYCYDPTGNLTSVVYPDGNAGGTAPCGTNTADPYIVDPKAYPAQGGAQTTYSYDNLGELTSVTRPATAAAPNGATTSYTYSPDGDTLTSASPDGITTSYTYTLGGAVAGVSYSGGSAHSVSYSYDANGNRTAMTDATGTSSFSYDPFGELTATTNGAGQNTGYGYNPDGQMAAITYPLPATATWATSPTVNYTYDNAGLLTKLTDFNGNPITIANTADAMPTSATLGSAGDIITTSYDPTDAPSAITLKNSTSTLQSFTYTYGPDGSVANEADTPSSAQSPSYTYDSQGRVTSMTPGSGPAQNYTFDPSGNLTTLPGGATVSSNGYDGAGELKAATLGGTTTNYAYDPSGNRLTSKQGSTTISSGSWNGEGQLISYSNPAADMSAAAYDGDGMRASSNISPAGGSALTQNYVWNGDCLLMDGVNAYIYAGGNAPAEQVNLATGKVSCLSADSLGSVRGTIDSTGTLTATTSYDAWGNPATPGGLTSLTPFGYAGGYTDPTGLIYLVNRYYDPAAGQFISLDPQVDGTLQPYSYAGGNPVTTTDPTGLYPTCSPLNSSARFEYACKFTVGQINSTTSCITCALTAIQIAVAACVAGGPVGLAGCLLGVGIFWKRVHNGGAWDWKVDLGGHHRGCSRCGNHDIDGKKGEWGELNWYSRVNLTKQIFYNVWANIFYGYVGRAAGFPGSFLQTAAGLNGKLGTGHNTPGNRIERQMGIDLYNRYGDPNRINSIILGGLGSFGHLCDVRPFPDRKLAHRCRDYHWSYPA